METEKIIKGQNGYVHLLITLLLIAGAVFLFTQKNMWGIGLIVLALIHAIGFVVVNPNKAVVLVLFGAYKGTIVKNGFYWVNPFYV